MHARHSLCHCRAACFVTPARGAGTPPVAAAFPGAVVDHHHAPAVRRQHAVAERRAAIWATVLQEVRRAVHLQRDGCRARNDDVDAALSALAPLLIVVRDAHPRQACGDGGMQRAAGGAVRWKTVNPAGASSTKQLRAWRSQQTRTLNSGSLVHLVQLQSHEAVLNVPIVDVLWQRLTQPLPQALP